jgi:hypothetical protein
VLPRLCPGRNDFHRRHQLGKYEIIDGLIMAFTPRLQRFDLSASLRKQMKAKMVPHKTASVHQSFSRSLADALPSLLGSIAINIAPCLY